MCDKCQQVVEPTLNVDPQMLTTESAVPHEAPGRAQRFHDCSPQPRKVLNHEVRQYWRLGNDICDHGGPFDGCLRQGTLSQPAVTLAVRHNPNASTRRQFSRHAPSVVGGR